VLRAEAVRGCAEAGRELDAPLLAESFRRADLLLLHLADVQALARGLSRCEIAG
jgi:xylose isomerase